MIDIPDMPKISLPGKGGRISGLKEAEAAQRKNAKLLKAERKRSKAAGKLVSWPPAPIAPPVVVQPAVATPAVAAAPMAPMAPVMAAAPMQQAMAPTMMMAP